MTRGIKGSGPKKPTTKQAAATRMAALGLRETAASIIPGARAREVAIRVNDAYAASQMVPAPAPASSEVHRELGRLEEFLAYVENTVEDLETRLGPVLVPPPPAGDTAGETEVEPMVETEIGKRIRADRERLNVQLKRLHYIIRRVGV